MNPYIHQTIEKNRLFIKTLNSLGFSVYYNYYELERLVKEKDFVDSNRKHIIDFYVILSKFYFKDPHITYSNYFYKKVFIISFLKRIHKNKYS